MRASFLGSLVLLGGCCRDDVAPRWSEVGTLDLEEGSTTFDLRDWVEDDSDELTFEGTTDGDVLASVDGDTLELAPQPGWTGTTSLALTATDACGNVGAASIDLRVGAGEGEGETVADVCPVTLRYTAQGEPDAVAVAGTWNEWDTDADRMADSGGAWSLTLELAPGAYAYKLVEVTEGLYEDETAWTCDPSAELIQCDEGYKSPDDTSWSQDCTLGAASCNSLLVVEDCGRPSLSLEALAIDRENGAVQAEVSATAGTVGPIETATVTLDGEPVEGAWDGSTFHVELDGLSASRHVLRFEVSDAEGNASPVLTVPFWLDDFDWARAVLYFAFVDRLANGDTAIDGSEGTSAETGDYLGGDWQGLIDLLPYLEDLGVTAIWLTNPQDNAESAWDGQCGETYSGYHGYWPVSATELEGHFGDEATLHALVDEAHARNMRVIADWVGNHVHEDHPYYQENPDWFGDYAWCEDADNWNDIPETCWFAPYLPDVDYYEVDPLVHMVDDAVALAVDWELDGLRVDAAKHVPHSVQWNLEHRIQAEIEHVAAGGDEEFWTVGETFDGYDRINAYIGEDQLDGQFDFPLYYAIRAAFLDGSITLPDLYDTAAYGLVVFDGAIMGTFLGNHDVSRFVTDGTEEDVGACESDNSGVRVAEAPTDEAVYDSLRLGWTFLLTWPGVPLVYYGDEIGLPGYGDPDNRQPMWWATGDLSGGSVTTVDDLADRVSEAQADGLYTIQALARARAGHPALYEGEAVNWWSEADVYGFARRSGEDAVLVVLNRSETDRTLTNGLAFAGLDEGTWEDLLTGDTFASSGDSLTLDVPARGARVLVRSE